MDKNFKFDISNKAILIGDIVLNPKTRQEDMDLLGYEYYNDYQNNYIYRLKQRLVFKNQNFKIIVIFKSNKIWLIEIKHENDIIVDNIIFNELYQDILTSSLTFIKKVDLIQNDLLRLEFVIN